jgi:hypothetical protein
MENFDLSGWSTFKTRLSRVWAAFKTLGLYRVAQEWLWWYRLSPAQRHLYEDRMSDDWIIRNRSQ